MKKLVAFAMVAVMAAMCGTAQAACKDKVWDDMSWWGNTGAIKEPVKDSCRSGYWWWPKQPASNANDAELWGNRGVVYSMWQKPQPPEPPKEPTPEPPTVTRKAIVLNNVLFDFDKSTLKPEGKMEIDKLVKEMKKYPKDTVLIEGHTCSIGTEAYNMGLGQRRADAVKAYMIDNGISASRISTISYGETKPAVSNATPESRKGNRRAEFNITLGD